MRDRKTAKKVDVLTDEALGIEQELTGLNIMYNGGNKDVEDRIIRWRTYLDMLYRSIGMKIVESKRQKISDKFSKEYGKHHQFE